MAGKRKIDSARGVGEKDELLFLSLKVFDDADIVAPASPRDAAGYSKAGPTSAGDSPLQGRSFRGREISGLRKTPYPPETTRLRDSTLVAPRDASMRPPPRPAECPASSERSELASDWSRERLLFF
jgi:hypothetical protein